MGPAGELARRLASTVTRVPAGSLLGLVGIGHMGGAMAANLLKHKHKVVVYDKSPAAMERLVKLGATTAESPAQLAATPGAHAPGLLLQAGLAAEAHAVAAAGS